VLLEVLSDAPEALRLSLLHSFEIHFFATPIAQNLRKFDARKVFELLPKMSSRSNERLVRLYGVLLVADKNADLELLKLFLSRRDAVGSIGIHVLNDALVSLLKVNEDQFYSIVRDNILSDENLISHVIQQPLISEVISGIKPQTDQARCAAKVDFYLSVKSNASDQNKSNFVRAILTIMTARDITALEPRVVSALDTLISLDSADVPNSVKGECLDAIEKLSGRIADPGEKLHLFRFILKHHKVLDRTRVDSLLKPFIDTAPRHIILDLVKSSREFQVPLASSEALLSSLGARVNRDIPDQGLIEYLIEKSPTELKNQVVNLIVDLIRTNDAGRFHPALNAAINNVASLPADGVNRICIACVEGLHRLGASVVTTMLDPALKLLPQTSDVPRKVLTDLLVEWIKSDDPNLRNMGSSYYRRARDQVAQERRSEIAREIVLRLQSISNRIDQASVLIDLIVEDWGFVEGQYKDLFVDILTAQLSTAKPENLQLLGITSLGKLDSLGGRAGQAMNGLLALGKASTGSVRNVCKKTLASMRRFKAPDSFWREVEKLE